MFILCEILDIVLDKWNIKLIIFSQAEVTNPFYQQRAPFLS